MCVSVRVCVSLSLSVYVCECMCAIADTDVFTYFKQHISRFHKEMLDGFPTICELSYRMDQKQSRMSKAEGGRTLLLV